MKPSGVCSNGAACTGPKSAEYANAAYAIVFAAQLSSFGLLNEAACFSFFGPASMHAIRILLLQYFSLPGLAGLQALASPPL
jgi:hypothetical protein